MSEAPPVLVQQYAQKISVNEALRDQLEPDQAERLLAWGLATLVQRATEVSATELADTAAALSRLLRQVNGLSPTLAYLVEDELAEDLALAFVGTVAEATGQAISDDWIDDLVSQRTNRDEAATFDHLLDTLHNITGA